ncbi:MAG: hypothetical protein NC318_07715 [Blautia sp.]|nr:hypothetical protein [Blautia sp.]
MEKYKEPQIYVINNSEIAEKLQENYTVSEGNLGIIKQINYESYENCRYLNLEYNLVGNLHEYKVIVIDMQSENIGKICAEDETPNDTQSMFRVTYPTQEFNPSPLVMNHIPKIINKENLRVIFSDINYTEKYEIVEVIKQNQYGYPEEFTENIYKTIAAEAINKSGKKIKAQKYHIAQMIAKYVVGYKVIFELPTIWNTEEQKSILHKNFIPLVYNQDNEVISYYGYNEENGYELLLPICRDKEQLMDELCTQIFPEMLPNIFPESREFCWLNDDEYKPVEILEIDIKKKELKKEYDDKLRLIEKKEQQIYEKYQFLNDLLTQTGDRLVKAVCKYLEWLGFSDVKEIDGSEEILREDIQIIDGSDLFIIEVKGIGGTSTDAECAQIVKHRRKREKENRDMDIIPIYIVNHQRYIKPQLRKNPPFSPYQIEYAQIEERGLLTTWKLYQQFKLIKDGVFTKEETRQAMKQIGLVTLLPKDFDSIGVVTEYYKKPKACIINLKNTEIKCGICVWGKKEDVWKKGKICSIQVDGKDVDAAKDGEVGVVLDIELANGFELFVRK